MGYLHNFTKIVENYKKDLVSLFIDLHACKLDLTSVSYGIIKLDS
jgi:hypothetical protein